MTQIKDGGPAFPSAGDELYNREFGMTLRDWFAGQALAGLLSDDGTILRMRSAAEADGQDLAKWMASGAFELATAMIAEREERQP
jgi:hypothetical protein|nr:MAG TPA: hypothetical protein [Caudoviricetes sp.]